MYATLETYDLHDPKCPLYHNGGCGGNVGCVREGFEPTPKPRRPTPSPEARRRARGGRGIDGCRPYDPYSPYRYMFDPRYNPYPYGHDYKIVDGEDDGKRYLPSYPSTESTTRVFYCDAAPPMWQFCDDDA